MSILEEVRAALFSEFGSRISEDEDSAKSLIEKHTFLPEDDSGQWAPSAAVVIHAESIPLPAAHEFRDIEAWCRVSTALSSHFCEHVNDAVVAVYNF